MIMVMINRSKFQENEQGFASLVIALVIIVVIALITVGFAQLSRREQQTALDKQLANQAYYAAESGVNDTYYLIQNALVNPAATPSLTTLGTYKNVCLPPSILPHP